MAIWKFSAKSHSTCISSNGIRLFALFAAVLLSFIAVCVSVFAWYSVMRSSHGAIEINSDGIKIDATLSYVENVNFEGIPLDMDYIEQPKTSTRIEHSGECFAGSMLRYKISVSNNSNQQSNVAKTVPVNISVSMSNIGAYFNTLVETYMANPTDSSISSTISQNNGTILYKLVSVKYVLSSDPIKTLHTYAIPENSFIASAYALGEPFFNYAELGVGDTITVYFDFECEEPLNASFSYEAFRKTQIASELNPVRALAIESVYKEELKSLVIRQESTGASMENAFLRIKYFSVYATPSL